MGPQELELPSPLLPLPQAAVKVHVALGADLAVHSIGLGGHSWSCGQEPPCASSSTPAPVPRTLLCPHQAQKPSGKRQSPQGVPLRTVSPVTHCRQPQTLLWIR